MRDDSHSLTRYRESRTGRGVRRCLGQEFHAHARQTRRPVVVVDLREHGLDHREITTLLSPLAHEHQQLFL